MVPYSPATVEHRQSFRMLRELQSALEGEAMIVGASPADSYTLDFGHWFISEAMSRIQVLMSDLGLSGDEQWDVWAWYDRTVNSLWAARTYLD